MKAISLWQPWATLWVLSNPSEKVFETRHWPTRYRGPLLVHAAKKQDRQILEAVYDERIMAALIRHGIHGIADLAFGSLIGRVDLVSCDQMADLCDQWSPSEDEQAFGDWKPERYAWKRGPTPELWSSPIPWRGAQGFFDVPGNVLAGINHADRPNIGAADAFMGIFGLKRIDGVLRKEAK